MIQNVAELPAPISAYESRAAWNQTGTATEMLDTMSLNISAGLVKVANTTLSAIHSEDIRLPDGQSYSPEVGILSLGSPDGIKALDNATGWTFPGYLHSQNITPSNSAGLHYGSAAFEHEGSLTWGGYDQSRVIGDVGVFSLFQPEGLIMPSLLDIQIGVEAGSSPFNASSITGLLEQNKTIGTQLPTLINPTIPYMYMSPQTCANIAQYLPVSLQSAIGLYTWNTSDPRYSQIVQSASYLAFTFQSGSTTASGNLTIKVPFSLLNLTLESPIVPSRQQYFPCQPFAALDGSGYYFLGRSFLQAAFLGINWNQTTYFLAQAPGPSADAPNIQPIGTNDTTLKSQPASKFGQSWAGHWTVLDSANSSSSATNSTTPTPAETHSADHGKSGLSSGAIAGASIGSVLGVLAILGLFSWLFIRSKRRHVVADFKEGASELNGKTNGLPQEVSAQHGVPEAEGDGLRHEKLGRERHEAEGQDKLVYEKPADGEVQEM